MGAKDNSGMADNNGAIVICADFRHIAVPLICMMLMVLGALMILVLGVRDYWLASGFIAFFALAALIFAAQVPLYWRIDNNGVKARYMIRRCFFPWETIDVVDSEENNLIFRSGKSLFSIRVPVGNSLDAEEPVIKRNVLARSERLVENVSGENDFKVKDYVVRREGRYWTIGLILYIAFLVFSFIMDTLRPWSDLKQAVITVCLSVVLGGNVLMLYLKRNASLRVNAQGLRQKRGRKFLEIAWEDVSVIDDENGYTLQSAQHPDWKFSLDDSMANYHAARLLLRRKGLLPE